MKIKKSYAVFGLGRYGMSVARELVATGAEVLAVDRELSTVKSIFIELNEVQDVHEYEISIPADKFAHYGLCEDDTWSEMRIPLSDMRKNLRVETFGNGDTITLRNFRYCLSAQGDATYDTHIDLVYITTKENLGM